MIAPISTHIAHVIVNVTVLLPKYSVPCLEARAACALALVMLLALRGAEISLGITWGAFEFKLARAGAGTSKAVATGSKTEATGARATASQAPRQRPEAAIEPPSTLLIAKAALKNVVVASLEASLEALTQHLASVVAAASSSQDQAPEGARPAFAPAGPGARENPAVPVAGPISRTIL